MDAEGGGVSEDVVVVEENVEGGNSEEEKEEPLGNHNVSAGGSGILKHVPPKEEGEPQGIVEESPSKMTSKGLAVVRRWSIRVQPYLCRNVDSINCMSCTERSPHTHIIHTSFIPLQEEAEEKAGACMETGKLQYCGHTAETCFVFFAVPIC